jgi:hypothetical protein
VATAFDTYGPFNTGSGANATEDQWRAFMRRISVSGVMRNINNEMLVYGDSTGLQVKVKTGDVWIEGHGGTLSAEKTLAIASNSSGQPRLDLVVARAHFVNDVIELDVLTGTAAATPLVPSVTRSSSLWEIPLAVVSIPSGDASIDASQVTDARQWGGPSVPTVTDDYLLYGDKISSHQRINMNGDAPINNGILYFVRIHSLIDQLVSKVRVFPTTAQVAGSASLRIFRGYRQDQLKDFIDPTGLSLTTGVNTVKEGTFTPFTLRAGETVAVVVTASGTTTAPILGCASCTATGGIGNLINPDTAGAMTCGFKTASMPTTLNLLDGSWSKRDRFFWVALL